MTDKKPNPRAGKGGGNVRKQPVSAKAVQTKAKNKVVDGHVSEVSQVQETTQAGDNLGEAVLSTSNESATEASQDATVEASQAVQNLDPAEAEKPVAESTDKSGLADLMSGKTVTIAGKPTLTVEGTKEAIIQTMPLVREPILSILAGADPAIPEEPEPQLPPAIIAHADNLKEEMGETLGAVMLDPRYARVYTLGQRSDGSYGVVISVPEGYIDAIQQQAESDKITVEEWCSIRFAEVMDAWWGRARSR